VNLILEEYAQELATPQLFFKPASILSPAVVPMRQRRTRCGLGNFEKNLTGSEPPVVFSVEIYPS
jgi:hypothetical protein